MKSDPLQQFINLPKTARNTCFLYSATNGKSILASSPIAKFSGKNIQEFKKFIKKYNKKLLIGYISYDVAYQLFNIKQKAKNDLHLPEIYFLAFDKWLEFNKHEHSNCPYSHNHHK
ncbi:MAG: hypothetical protein AAB953_01455, partial [Patescibacteria group bacterium]